MQVTLKYKDSSKSILVFPTLKAWVSVYWTSTCEYYTAAGCFLSVNSSYIFWFVFKTMETKARPRSKFQGIYESMSNTGEHLSIVLSCSEQCRGPGNAPWQVIESESHFTLNLTETKVQIVSKCS